MIPDIREATAKGSPGIFELMKREQNNRLYPHQAGRRRSGMKAGESWFNKKAGENFRKAQALATYFCIY